MHLIFSCLIVVPVAFVYGFYPNLLFDVNVISSDEASIFKAIMGLYLGFSILWINGIFKTTIWKTATISNMIFMLALAFGRIISIVFDGLPSIIFILGTIGELVLGWYAWFQLKQESKLIKAL